VQESRCRTLYTGDPNVYGVPRVRLRNRPRLVGAWEKKKKGEEGSRARKKDKRENELYDSRCEIQDHTAKKNLEKGTYGRRGKRAEGLARKSRRRGWKECWKASGKSGGVRGGGTQGKPTKEGVHVEQGGADLRKIEEQKRGGKRDREKQSNRVRENLSNRDETGKSGR